MIPLLVKSLVFTVQEPEALMVPLLITEPPAPEETCQVAPAVMVQPEDKVKPAPTVEVLLKEMTPETVPEQVRVVALLSSKVIATFPLLKVPPLIVKFAAMVRDVDGKVEVPAEIVNEPLSSKVPVVAV